MAHLPIAATAIAMDTSVSYFSIVNKTPLNRVHLYIPLYRLILVFNLFLFKWFFFLHSLIFSFCPFFFVIESLNNVKYFTICDCILFIL